MVEIFNQTFVTVFYISVEDSIISFPSKIRIQVSKYLEDKDGSVKS